MPRLTDQETQDVIRCLEADKPLPDNYRFLLFGDKRDKVVDIFGNDTMTIVDVMVGGQ